MKQYIEENVQDSLSSIEKCLSKLDKSSSDIGKIASVQISSENKKTDKVEDEKPRGPNGIPIFGNLPDLGLLPHRELMNMTKDYGNIIHLNLGWWKGEVINGYKACKEVFLKHGKTSSSRPDFRSYKHYSYGKSMSFQPLNEVWQLQRRIVSRSINKMISSGFVTELANRETKVLVSNWVSKSTSDTSFDPLLDLAEAVSSFIYSFCYGRNEHLNGNERFKKILMDYNPGTDMFAFGQNPDLLPFFLRPFLKNKEADHTKRMNSLTDCHYEMKRKLEDLFFNNFNPDTTCLQEVIFVEIESMFAEEEDEIVLEEGTTMLKDHLMNLPAEFLSAGSETSTASLLWLLRYMAKNPTAQKNVHKEIDLYMANKTVSLTDQDPEESKMVEYSDKDNLPYTEACRMESLRCVAVVPFGLPHYSSGDANIGDVPLPNGTLLYPNLWSIGRDSSVWHKPHHFIPERHLIYQNENDDNFVIENKQINEVKTKDNDDNKHSTCAHLRTAHLKPSTQTASRCPFAAKITKEEKFYPFGLGKRRCVGEQMAKILNFVVFANIMLNFEVKIQKDTTKEITTTTIKKQNDKKEKHFFNNHFFIRSVYIMIVTGWNLVKKYVFWEDLDQAGKPLKNKTDYNNNLVDEEDDGTNKEKMEDEKDKEDDDLAEVFGDVMLPSSYKILLERRNQN